MENIAELQGLKLEEIQSTCVSKVTECETVKSSCESIKSECETVKSDIDTIKSEIDTLKTETDTECNNLKADYEQLKADYDELNANYQAVINKYNSDIQTVDSIKTPVYGYNNLTLEEIFVTGTNNYSGDNWYRSQYLKIEDENFNETFNTIFFKKFWITSYLDTTASHTFTIYDRYGNVITTKTVTGNELYYKRTTKNDSINWAQYYLLGAVKFDIEINPNNYENCLIISFGSDSERWSYDTNKSATVFSYSSDNVTYTQAKNYPILNFYYVNTKTIYGKVDTTDLINQLLERVSFLENLHTNEITIPDEQY